MIRTKTIAKWCQRWTVAISLLGVAFIAYVIATSPEPYVDDAPAAQVVCLDDDISDVYINPDFTPWSELFPDGHEYGKDGEVIVDVEDDIGIELDGMPYSEPSVPGVDAPAARSAPTVPGIHAPMARMPWFYDGRVLPKAQGGSIDKHGCAPSVVSEPKSWHLIIIGLLSFAVWRWVRK